MSKVRKTRRTGIGQSGIVMVGGITLKNGLDSFEADEKLVQTTLNRVAKISKGLYSGIMNSDPDFIKFQEESMGRIIALEATELCGEVVLGAEKQLANIAKNTLIEEAVGYRVGRGRTVQEIDIDPKSSGIVSESDLLPIELGEDKNEISREIKKRIDPRAIGEIINERGDSLASLSQEEIENIKKVTKETKEINAEARKIVESREKKRNKIAKQKEKTIADRISEKAEADKYKKKMEKRFDKVRASASAKKATKKKTPKNKPGSGYKKLGEKVAKTQRF